MKNSDREYTLSINWDDRPGVLGFEVAFIGQENAWSMSVFKHPDHQNQEVHYYGIREHEFILHGELMDSVNCGFSPSGHCRLTESWPRYGEWKEENIVNATGLTFCILDLIAQNRLGITNEEAQTIWDACVKFWDTDAQKEN